MSDVKNVLQMIKDHDVKYVDLRFTDPRGKWQHTAQTVSTIDEDVFVDGFMFDGSSIAGWKAIQESDMILMPDPKTAVIDPFAAQTSLIMFCDIIDPGTGQGYERDPRSTARRAEAYLASTGIGDQALFGPELEFFVFDDVRFDVSMNNTFYSLDYSEAPHASGAEFEDGNLGHRPPIKGGYFPVPPVDSASDLRAEMLTFMGEMGIPIEKHHHEVAPGQHELGFRFGPLLQMGDTVQMTKYVVHQVACAYGKSATFMPKPVVDDNGSGMHVHQSIFKNGEPTFAGNGYADLSENALYYIGGIIKHSRAINAFTNSTTNSYKRLVKGFEAPVQLAYSARNRSASCRIPYATNPKGKRVEIRYPDAASNPYLAFAAMLMAGLDGIANRIHPGEPMDKNLYDLPPEELATVPSVCGSLGEALDALAEDRAFLTKGGVFTDNQIDGYIDLKREEVTRFESTPHPVEFSMYYSV